MSQQREITLGGQSYPVKPITLGTLKKIGESAARQRHGATMQRDPSQDWAKAEGEWYSASIAIVCDGTGLSPKDIEVIENVTLDELTAAVAVIYDVTGLVAKKDAPKVGEEAGAKTG